MSTTTRPYLRYLRSAFSAMCGIACVLLVVLWVRSYWRLEILEKRIGLHPVQISSVKGSIAIAHLDVNITIGTSYLNVVASDAAEWRKGGFLGFAHYNDGLVAALVAPHWLSALLFATLTAIPWIARSWRFSLRTLLIAITLVGLLLGFIIATIR